MEARDFSRVRLHKIIADDGLDGLVINPWTEHVFVLDKRFLTEVIGLLETSIEEKPVKHTEKFRDEADAVYRINTLRPMSRDEIAGSIGTTEEQYIIIVRDD